jgi:hypothetical protein
MDPFEILVEAHRPALKGALAKLVAIFREPVISYEASRARRS